MNNTNDSKGTPQGFGNVTTERLPLPPHDAMNDAQRDAVNAIINGPRKAIFGPFIPLLQTPELMEHVGNVGATLRFNGTLADNIRELVICVVARETGNQFEWQTHAPLAVKAGVPQSAIDSLAAGRRPKELRAPEASAVDLTQELMRRNGVCDETYAEAVALWGQHGVVELTALIGYFVMICWVMNVGRTHGPAGSTTSPLRGFPE